MGGSVGGGTSQSSSQNVQNSVFSPPAWAAAAGQQAVQAGQSLAQMPFEVPQQPIAPLQPQQSEAFQTVENLQGAFTPYAEAGLMAQGQGSTNPYQAAAASLQTFPGAMQYFGGEAAGVVPQLENIFGQQTAQNTGQLVQQAGGLGADRIGIGQAELANQQGLAAGQTLSQLMGQAVTQGQQAGTNLSQIGLSGANLEQQAGMNATNIANTAQNMGLSGAQAELNAGNLQQQQLQNQENAIYSNDLQAISWPFQTNEYLGALTSGITPSMGGSGISSGISNVQSSSLNGSLSGSGKGAMGAMGKGSGGRIPYASGGRLPYAGGGVTFMGSLDGAPAGAMGNPFQNPWQRETPTFGAPSTSANPSPQGQAGQTPGLASSAAGMAPGGTIHGSPMQKGGSAPGGVQGPGNMPGQSLSADQQADAGSEGFQQGIGLPGADMPSYANPSAWGELENPTYGRNAAGAFIGDSQYLPNGPNGPGFYSMLNGVPQGFIGTIPPPAAPPPIALAFPTQVSYAQNAGAPVLPNRNPNLGGQGPVPFTASQPFETAYEMNTGTGPREGWQFMTQEGAGMLGSGGPGTANNQALANSPVGTVPFPNQPGQPPVTPISSAAPGSANSPVGTNNGNLLPNLTPGGGQDQPPTGPGFAPTSFYPGVQYPGGTDPNINGNQPFIYGQGITPSQEQSDLASAATTGGIYSPFFGADSQRLPPSIQAQLEQFPQEQGQRSVDLANTAAGGLNAYQGQTGIGQMEPTSLYSQMLSGLISERGALQEASQLPAGGGSGASAATQAAPTFGAGDLSGWTGALFGGGGGGGGGAGSQMSLQQIAAAGGAGGGGNPFARGRAPSVAAAGTPNGPNFAGSPLPPPPNVSGHAEGGRARGEVSQGRPITAPPGFYDKILPNMTDLAQHARWDRFEQGARPSQNIDDLRTNRDAGGRMPMAGGGFSFMPSPGMAESGPGVTDLSQGAYQALVSQGLAQPGERGIWGVYPVVSTPQQAPAPPPPPMPAPTLANPNIGSQPVGGIGGHNGATAATQAAPTFGVNNFFDNLGGMLGMQGATPAGGTSGGKGSGTGAAGAAGGAGGGMGGMSMPGFNGAPQPPLATGGRIGMQMGGAANPWNTGANPMNGAMNPMSQMGSMAGSPSGGAGKGAGSGLGTMPFAHGGRVLMQTGGVPGKGSGGTSIGGSGMTQPQFDQAMWNSAAQSGISSVSPQPTPYGNGPFEALGGMQNFNAWLPPQTPQGMSAIQPFEGNKYVNWTGTNGQTPAGAPTNGITGSPTGQASGRPNDPWGGFAGQNMGSQWGNINSSLWGGPSGEWQHGGRTPFDLGGASGPGQAQQTNLTQGGINPNGGDAGGGASQGPSNLTSGDPTSMGGPGPIASAMSTPIKPGGGAGLSVVEKMNQAAGQQNQQAAQAAAKPQGGQGGSPGGGKGGGGKGGQKPQQAQQQPQQAQQDQSQPAPAAQPAQPQQAPGGEGTINTTIPGAVVPLGPSANSSSPFTAGPVASATSGAPGNTALAMPGSSGSPFNNAIAENPQSGGAQEVAAMQDMGDQAQSSADQQMASADQGGGGGEGDPGGGGDGGGGGDVGGGGFGYRGGRFYASGGSAAHALRLARGGRHYDDGGDTGGGDDVGSSGSNVSDIQPQLGDHGGSQTFANMPPPSAPQGPALNAQNTHGTVNWADVPKPNPVSTIAEAAPQGGSKPTNMVMGDIPLPPSRPMGGSGPAQAAAGSQTSSPFLPPQNTSYMLQHDNAPQHVAISSNGDVQAPPLDSGGGGPQGGAPWPGGDEYTPALRQIESGGSQHDIMMGQGAPIARTGSNVGRYQFSPDQFAQLGMQPGESPTDPAVQDRMLFNENQQNAMNWRQMHGGQDPTGSQMYQMHQQGPRVASAMNAPTNANLPANQVRGSVTGRPAGAETRAIMGQTGAHNIAGGHMPTAGQFSDNWNQQYAQAAQPFLPPGHAYAVMPPPPSIGDVDAQWQGGKVKKKKRRRAGR